MKSVFNPFSSPISYPYNGIAKTTVASINSLPPSPLTSGNTEAAPLPIEQSIIPTPQPSRKLYILKDKLETAAISASFAYALHWAYNGLESWKNLVAVSTSQKSAIEILKSTIATDGLKKGLVEPGRLETCKRLVGRTFIRAGILAGVIDRPWYEKALYLGLADVGYQTPREHKQTWSLTAKKEYSKELLPSILGKEKPTFFDKLKFLYTGSPWVFGKYFFPWSVVFVTDKPLTKLIRGDKDLSTPPSILEVGVKTGVVGVIDGIISVFPDWGRANAQSFEPRKITMAYVLSDIPNIFKKLKQVFIPRMGQTLVGNLIVVGTNETAKNKDALINNIYAAIDSVKRCFGFEVKPAEISNMDTTDKKAESITRTQKIHEQDPANSINTSQQEQKNQESEKRVNWLKRVLDNNMEYHQPEIIAVEKKSELTAEKTFVEKLAGGRDQISGLAADIVQQKKNADRGRD
jgi:hypothetical protein